MENHSYSAILGKRKASLLKNNRDARTLIAGIQEWNTRLRQTKDDPSPPKPLKLSKPQPLCIHNSNESKQYETIAKCDISTVCGSDTEEDVDALLQDEDLGSKRHREGNAGHEPFALALDKMKPRFEEEFHNARSHFTAQLNDLKAILDDTRGVIENLQDRIKVQDVVIRELRDVNHNRLTKIAELEQRVQSLEGGQPSIRPPTASQTNSNLPTPPQSPGLAGSSNPNSDRPPPSLLKAPVGPSLAKPKPKPPSAIPKASPKPPPSKQKAPQSPLKERIRKQVPVYQRMMSTLQGMTPYTASLEQIPLPVTSNKGLRSGANPRKNHQTREMVEFIKTWCELQGLDQRTGSTKMYKAWNTTIQKRRKGGKLQENSFGGAIVCFKNAVKQLGGTL